MNENSQRDDENDRFDRTIRSPGGLDLLRVAARSLAMLQEMEWCRPAGPKGGDVEFIDRRMGQGGKIEFIVEGGEVYWPSVYARRRQSVTVSR